MLLQRVLSARRRPPSADSALAAPAAAVNHQTVWVQGRITVERLVRRTKKCSRNHSNVSEYPHDFSGRLLCCHPFPTS